MPDFDLDIDHELQTERKGGAGCAFGGWSLFLIVAVMVGVFGYRTWYYYKQLHAGNIVNLPQFTDRFTSVGNKGIPSASTVERSAVESPAAAAQGPEQQDAKLVIVEFADFQCPYSKDESLVVRTLMQKYGDKVRFEYRDFPLTELHQDATQAAVAARCAMEQGKFWSYHDKLFVNAPLLTRAMLEQYAVEAGLDPVQFNRCLTDQRYLGAVSSDSAAALRLGLQGTPTFFLNGHRIDGAIPADVFEDLIQKMLQ